MVYISLDTFLPMVYLLLNPRASAAGNLKKQDRPLYIVFVNFTKAFDTVGRTGLWQLLRKNGCPEKFTPMIESLHTGIMVNVRN